MSEACNHDCESCGSKCAEQDLHAKLNAFSSIKKVVAVSSGKGGVGKSSVTAMLAVMTARRGYKVGILDADITGPSIPKAFGITRKARGSEMGILPEETHMGIKVMSINLLLEREDQPVVWRGRSSPEPSPSSGRTSPGAISTCSSSTCRREPAMCR